MSRNIFFHSMLYFTVGKKPKKFPQHILHSLRWKITAISFFKKMIFFSIINHLPIHTLPLSTKFWNYHSFVSWRSIFFLLVTLVGVSNFLSKYSASTTESTIPSVKKFSCYKKKNMAHRRSIYKAKTNSFFEDNWRKLEFRGELFGESWFHNSIFQMQLVSLQIMPGICTPYWKNRAWIW